MDRRSKINEDFINKYNKEKDSIEVDVQYPEKLHELQNDLPFLPEGMKPEKRMNITE